MILQFCHLELVERYIDNQIIKKLRLAQFDKLLYFLDNLFYLLK